jgi:hypothetical protein
MLYSRVVKTGQIGQVAIACVSVCVSLCVCERDGETLERERQNEGERASGQMSDR